MKAPIFDTAWGTMENVRVIKKYQNRKLYDIQESRYVTLTELAGFIEQGFTLNVVDNVSAADLTAVILTEILMEVEKANAGQIPVTILKEIIKSGEGSVFQFLKLFVLGAVDGHQDKAAELQHFIDIMAKNGDLSLEEQANLTTFLRNAQANAKLPIEQRVEDAVTKALDKVKIVFKIQKDIQKLRTKILHLESEVRRMERSTANS